MKKRVRKCGSNIGGQAVLEGIMMKSKEKYAIAVRTADGSISVEVDEYPGVLAGSFFKKAPFFRGVLQFMDSMILGMKALNHSAEFFEEEEEQPAKPRNHRLDKLILLATMTFSFVLAMAIFIVLPYVISSLIVNSFDVINNSLLVIIEGFLRILIFLVYVAAISLMKDIKRMYMYHGAEHKCINCLESGRPLVVEEVKKASRLHKRCGTSFMLLVMAISILIFFFIPPFANPVYRVLLRLALVPLIAGISYEVIRLAGKTDNLLMRIISAPGMGLQMITTKEPDDSMIEVAIEAISAIFDWKEFINEKFTNAQTERSDGPTAKYTKKSKQKPKR